MKNTRQRKEKKIQENLSVKKPEFKDKSVELAVTSALRLEQINQYSKKNQLSIECMSVSGLRFYDE